MNHATAFGVTAPLGELAKMPQPLQYGFHLGQPISSHSQTELWILPWTPRNKTTAFPSEFSIVKNFLGVGNGFPGYTVGAEPPDTNMAVGGTQVLQWVNRFLHHM